MGLETQHSSTPTLPSPHFRFVDSPAGSCRLRKMRRTKIVCTIGPVSSSDKMLEGLIRAGMNVARLNFSHGDYSFHRRVIRKIRQLERKLDQPVAILHGDGEIELEALQVSKHEVKCRIIVGGILGSHKGIHFPRGSLNIRALTHDDKKDLAFGIEEKVDMVALSFVRTVKIFFTRGARCNRCNIAARRF